VVLFGLLGIYLLFLKATNREFPRFGLGRARLPTPTRPAAAHRTSVPVEPAADSGSLPAS
jgi:hypothetical protein